MQDQTTPEARSSHSSDQARSLWSSDDHNAQNKSLSLAYVFKKGRALELAFPNGGNFIQQDAIKRAMDYSKTKNVNIKIIEIKK